MDAIPSELGLAALGARNRLVDLAGRTARAGLNRPGAQGAQTAMAAAAREAVFTDALLGAMRARLEEIKTAAK